MPGSSARPPAALRRTLRPVAAIVLTATLVATGVASASATTVITPDVRVATARAVTREQVLAAAAGYASTHGYHVGIAVLDTATGQTYGAGDHRGTFASESVVKVLIATRLLVEGRMHGRTRARAYTMITQSDDSIASSLYGSVGGDSLITWIKRRYQVYGLGWPPQRSGWWGNTHLIPDGLVALYAKLRADRRVGPWLLNAMHHATEHGSDGFYQWFGLRAADPHAAIKQGWGTDYDDWGASADENTTGFVGGDRYVVAILARGPASTYGARIGALLTHVARLLLPGGRFPSARPRITSMSARSASTTGRTSLQIRGSDLDATTGVYVGGVPVRRVRVISSGLLQARMPAHPPGWANVRVVTTHGTTRVADARIKYVAPPAITGVDTGSGRTAGGTTVTITGTDFTHVAGVRFGAAPATDVTRLSRRALRVTAPAHGAGRVDVRVLTGYGESRRLAADRFRFVAPPSVTGLSAGGGPTPGGQTLTVTGTGFAPGDVVHFARVAATIVTFVSSTELQVVVPAHRAAVVHVRVSGPYGASAPDATNEYAYAT